jgi:hypothetical protein
MIQIALEKAEGVDFYQMVIPSIPPKKEGELGYAFYEPGKRPFYSLKAMTCDKKCAKDINRFVRILKMGNPDLLPGSVSAAIIDTTDSLVVIRLRVGEDSIEALTKADFKVSWGMGTIELIPQFPVRRSAGEEEEAMEA